MWQDVTGCGRMWQDVAGCGRMWQAWWSWGRYPKIAEYFQVTLVEALPGLLTMFLISKDLVIYRPYRLSECKQSNNNFRVRTLATWGGPMTAIVNRNDTCCCWNPTCWATCCDCDAWIVAWDGMFLRSLWCWALACPQCGALSEVQQICWQLGVHRLFTSFRQTWGSPFNTQKNAFECASLWFRPRTVCSRSPEESRCRNQVATRLLNSFDFDLKKKWIEKIWEIAMAAMGPVWDGSPNWRPQ